MDVRLREMTPADWPSIVRIYGEGIESGDATFERTLPEWERWDAARRPDCRLVAVDTNDTVVGFAVVSPTSKREVYAGVCESMVYVARAAQGAGVGGILMAALVEATEAAGIWMLQASIFPENVASIRAHERVGFRIVGTREKIGRFYDGRWRDTVFMDRRSKSVGRD